MNRIIRNTGFYLIIFLVTVGIFQFISSQNDTTVGLRYDELRAAVESGNVKELSVKYENQTYFVSGKYKTKPAGAESDQFVSRVSVKAEEKILEWQEQYRFQLREQGNGPAKHLAYIPDFHYSVCHYLRPVLLLDESSAGRRRQSNELRQEQSAAL